MKIRNLILVRHGQSEWNEKNLFTGWENPGLTELGVKEAHNAGELIASEKIIFDIIKYVRKIWTFYRLGKSWFN